METPKYNSATEVLYAKGTSRRYWILKTTTEERPQTPQEKHRGKAPKWDLTYHLVDEKGNTTKTRFADDILPADLPNTTDEETPSAIKFLRRIQEEKRPSLKPGDLVTIDADGLWGDDDKPTDVHRITGKTWIDESDDSPMYGYWVLTADNLTSGTKHTTVMEDFCTIFEGPQPED